MRISKRRDKEPINLLLLENERTYHYTLITNFNALLCYDPTNTKEFCPYCMHGFDKRCLDTDEKKAVFEEHKKTCFNYGGVKIKFPENTQVKFTQISKSAHMQVECFNCFEIWVNST